MTELEEPELIDLLHFVRKPLKTETGKISKYTAVKETNQDKTKRN